jgi:hypothetical protein
MRFLITLIFISSTLHLFGQDFYRANYFEVGYKDTTTKEIFWQDKEKMESTLVAMGSRRITIHSEKLQQYFIQGPKNDLSDFEGFSSKAINSEGKDFAILFYKDVDDINYLLIENELYLLKLSLFYLEQ